MCLASGLGAARAEGRAEGRPPMSGRRKACDGYILGQSAAIPDEARANLAILVQNEPQSFPAARLGTRNRFAS
jgi:hypothetical protein